jgi:glycosyltransferase involved in cell wall biosynthesis
MAAGARVVGTEVDGIPDILQHGENGWLCRPKDPADLARKILLALEDEESSGILEAALSTARNLSWPAIATRYHALFERCLRSRTEP